MNGAVVQHDVRSTHCDMSYRARRSADHQAWKSVPNASRHQHNRISPPKELGRVDGPCLFKEYEHPDLPYEECATATCGS